MGKLTERQRKNIVASYAAGGVTMKDLACKYGVDAATISRIIKRDAEFANKCNGIKNEIENETVETMRDYFRIRRSQAQSLLEASFFGNHLKGTAARLGNVAEERTYVLKSITNVPRVGDRTEDGYCIAAVNTSFMPTLTKCTLALSKDFNRISQHVGINSSKRTYEISEKETYKRDVLIREKIVFGRTYRPSAENTIGKHSKNLVKVLDKKSFQPLTVVNVETYNFQGKRLAGATLPLVSSAFGNSLTFTWRHIDNYSSGTTALQMSKGNVKGSYVFDVPYADYYGRVYSYGFLLANGYSIDNTVDQALVAHAFPKYVKANDNYALSIGTTDDSRYLMRKDSREHISSFTLQFEYQSEDEDLIIGNALAAKNSLISNCDQAIKLYLFGEGVKIGRFQTHIRDIKDKVIETNENFDIIDVAGPTCKLHFTGQLTQDVCCWAIATVITSATHTYEDDYGNVSEVTTDTGGEILLACNTPALKGELLHPEIFISIQK